jgi:hypothetical protein
VNEAQNPAIEYDLRYLNAGIADLEAYLLSQEIYWPLAKSAPPGSPPYPRLTLGNLLLARARLSARRLTSTWRLELERLDGRLEETRQRWMSAWRQKAQREFGVRLNLWRDYLEEYRQNPEGNIDRYAYEVNRRVLLQLLEPEAGELPRAELELLSGLDQLLNAVFVSGRFVWERELERAFPAAPYWYLYGRPRAE